MLKLQRKVHPSLFVLFRNVMICFLQTAVAVGVVYLIGSLLADGVKDVLWQKPVLFRFITGLFVVLLTYALYHLLCAVVENTHNKSRSIHSIPLSIADIREFSMDTPWDFCFAMYYFFTYPRLPLFSFTPEYYPAYLHSVRCWGQALDLFYRLFNRMPAGFQQNVPYDWLYWTKNEIREKLRMPQDAEITPALMREVLSNEMLHQTGIILREKVEKSEVLS